MKPFSGHQKFIYYNMRQTKLGIKIKNWLQNAAWLSRKNCEISLISRQHYTKTFITFTIKM